MANIRLGPAIINLVGIVENDAWSLAITLTSNGLPVNLTGLPITAKMVTEDQEFPISTTVTDAVNGKLIISQNNAPSLRVARWAMRIGTRTYFAGSVTGNKDILT